VIAKRVAVAVQDVSSCATVPPAASIRKWARAALRGSGGGELTVRIVDPEESAELNRRYRKRAGATNVLSFPVGVAPPVPAPPLGDLVICALVVEREALEQGKAAEAHWAHIVMHGVLHLLGYDHETNVQAQTMECRERQLLAGFGFADPYEPGA
jgi:probable rRNA maturation factor